jgi:hypothetical protein
MSSTTLQLGGGGGVSTSWPAGRSNLTSPELSLPVGGGSPVLVPEFEAVPEVGSTPVVGVDVASVVGGGTVVMPVLPPPSLPLSPQPPRVTTSASPPVDRHRLEVDIAASYTGAARPGGRARGRARTEVTARPAVRGGDAGARRWHDGPVRPRTWILAALLVPPPLAAGAFYGWLSHPVAEDLPLPGFAVAFAGDAGQALLAGAAAADHAALARSFQPQEKRSWCGVAAAATVLSAMRGAPLSQDAFFTPEAEAVRSWWGVTFGGVDLVDLGGLLRAHGVRAEVHHADEGLAAFRAALARNAATAGDYLIVNWQRAALDQAGGGGHISPVSAYDPAGDRVLVLDVASYKYPWAWIPVARLFAAMDTRDGDRRRGWIEVSPAA